MKHSIPFLHIVIAALCAAAFLPSCVEKGCTDPLAINYNPDAQRDDESCYYGDKNTELKASILENHARIAYALYTDAHAKATVLATKAAAFTKTPTDDGFSETRLAWKQAYNNYLKCAALRFSNGPADSKGNDRLLGAWPIDPRLIDYVGQSNKGIVNDPQLLTTITTSTIEAKNEDLGSGQVTTGFHVVEFLLWGEDSADLNVLTQGNRSFRDYDQDDTTILNAERRADYLVASTELIVSHLSALVSAWDSTNRDSYRSTFLELENDDALKNVLTGIGTLTRAELAERAIENPLTTLQQSDEISTFSDNSSTDFISMKRSAEIIYTGQYISESTAPVNGASIQDLVLLLNPDLAASIDAQLDLCTEDLSNIPSPFDYQMGQENVSGVGPIHDAIESLKTLEDLWFEAAREIGFGLNTDLPE